MPDERTCRFCGAVLRLRRRHALYCGNACRADASRLRRLLDGEPVDHYRSVAAFVAACRSRHADTRRAANASDGRNRHARGNGQEDS